MNNAIRNLANTARNENGFTLGELLVVISIFGVVTTLVVSVILSAARGQASTTEYSDKVDARSVLIQNVEQAAAGAMMIQEVADAEGREHVILREPDADATHFVVNNEGQMLVGHTTGTEVEPASYRTIAGVTAANGGTFDVDASGALLTVTTDAHTMTVAARMR